MEIKTIKGFPDYRISSDGKTILNKHNRKLAIHTIASNGDAYQQIDLRINKRRICKPVHKLVADTFISNPNKCKIVFHKDGNRLNNDYTNLVWCNQKDIKLLKEVIKR